jgi:hypothetical protein
MFDNKLQVTKEIVEESVSYIGQWSATVKFAVNYKF